jgi:hypothetical protein
MLKEPIVHFSKGAESRRIIAKDDASGNACKLSAYEFRHIS